MGTDLRKPLEDKPEAVSLFDYWSSVALPERNHVPNPLFLGAVIETVRTFLAQWLTRTAQEPNWEPAISNECFEFDLSKNVCDVGRCDIHYHTLIWACQQVLQKEVSRTWSEHRNLPASHVLIMLFLMGFPDVNVNDDYDDQVVSLESNESLKRQSIEGNSSLNSRRQRTMNMSIKTYRVNSRTSPTDISVIIRVDFESCRVILQLESGSENSQFIWQDWVDTAMGTMKGLGGRTLNHDRWITRADLQEPIVSMSPLPDEYSRELGEHTGTVHIWMGWPPFDTRICKFEIDQWIHAYNMKSEDGMNRFICYEEWVQAKRVLKTIFITDTNETTGIDAVKHVK